MGRHSPDELEEKPMKQCMGCGNTSDNFPWYSTTFCTHSCYLAWKRKK
jgi:hypothetical protein